MEGRGEQQEAAGQWHKCRLSDATLPQYHLKEVPRNHAGRHVGVYDVAEQKEPSPSYSVKHMQACAHRLLAVGKSRTGDGPLLQSKHPAVLV